MVMTRSVIDRYIVRYGAVNLETINLFYLPKWQSVNAEKLYYLKRYAFSLISMCEKDYVKAPPTTISIVVLKFLETFPFLNLVLKFFENFSFLNLNIFYFLKPNFKLNSSLY